MLPNSNQPLKMNGVKGAAAAVAPVTSASTAAVLFYLALGLLLIFGLFMVIRLLVLPSAMLCCAVLCSDELTSVSMCVCACVFGVTLDR